MPEPSGQTVRTTFKIAANFPNPPYFYTNKTNDKSIINGIDFLIIKTILNHLNISYEFIHCNWTWGSLVNGSDGSSWWTGMIGTVVNKTTDLALGGLSANSDREKVVDFTIPYYYSDITFFTRMFKLSSINANSLLIEPFTTNVWITLLFTALFSVITLKIFKQNLKNLIEILVRALLQQGVPYIPRSLRLYAAIWLLFGLILSYSYVSVIFLFMSELIPRPGITSIQQLAIAVKNGQYIPATSGGGSMFKLIKDIKSSPLNSIGEALIDITKINTAMEWMLTNMSRLTYICPRLLINGRAPDFGVQYFNLPQKNDETTFLMEQLTIALPKHSELKDTFNTIIRRLESSAHLAHWERVSMRETSNFVDRSGLAIELEPPSEGMPLKTSQYIFYLWMLGIIISMFLYICEVMYKSLILNVSRVHKKLDPN